MLRKGLNFINKAIEENFQKKFKLLKVQVISKIL